jgi:hypothetical protein
MKGRKCHTGSRRYAGDRECHVTDVVPGPQPPNRRSREAPNRLLRHGKRHSRVLDPSVDPGNGAWGQQCLMPKAEVGGGRWEKPAI